MNKLYNLARVSTATTGTGTITLGAAASGFLTFAQAGIANGDVVTYAISDGANSEIGLGTYTTAGTTLSRDTVYRSTGAGNTAKISLSGQAQVFITLAAEDVSALYSTNGLLLGNGAGTITAASYEGDIPITSAHIDLDFVNAIYWNAPNNPINPFTVTRSGTAYMDDLSGNWTSVAANTLRQSNKGALFEESRINSIRNNSMQGAVAGSPGTSPTNWNLGAIGGLTQTIVGTGTELGVDYIDIRYNGTTSNTFFVIQFETSTQIVASNTQTWTLSEFVKLSGGTLTNITAVNLLQQELTSVGGFIRSDTGPTITPTATLQRFQYTVALSGGATVARLLPGIIFSYSSGVAVDFTIRIGWPQLELGSWATSPIRTTTVAVTRSADVVTLNSIPNFGSAMSMAVSATPLAPITFGNQYLMSCDDGTTNNRMAFLRATTTGNAWAFYEGGGVTTFNAQSLGVWAQNTSGTVAEAGAPANYAASFNGAAVTTGAIAGSMPTITTVHIGCGFNNLAFWNGYITRVLIWPTVRLGNQVVVDVATALPVTNGYAANPVSGITPGSVLFGSPTGVLAQDNTKFFWDDTNNFLGIGTATPAIPLDVTAALGVTSAKFGANFPVYAIAPTPSIGFNLYFNTAWKFGAASSAHYGGFISLQQSSGNLTFSVSSAAGAADATATMNTTMVITQTGLIALAGTTSAFPALKRSSTQLQVRLADDSADAPLSASTLTVSGLTASRFVTSGVGGLLGTSATLANLVASLSDVTSSTGTVNLVLSNNPVLVAPALGTPASGVLTNCTGLPVGSITGLAAGIATFLATPSSANLITAVTDETGTGALVFATSPTLVTPLLGTPTSGVLTNCTGLPVGSITGLAAGVATFLATPSSANLITAVTDETGTGALVFGTTPTLATPVINGLATGTGVASAATASTLMARDANSNAFASSLIKGYTTIVTAAGTTVLTVASNEQQFFTGTTTQIVTLPVVSTLALGMTIFINNNSTGAVTVNSSGGNVVLVLAGNTSAIFTVILITGTTAASWDALYRGSAITSGKILNINNSLTFSGTDGSTLNIGTGGTLGTNAYTSTAYAPIASPSFTGVVTMPTPFTLGAVSVTSTGTQLNYLNAATGTTGTTSTSVVFSASPTFTGTVTHPTPFTLGATSVTTTGTQLNYLNAATGTTGTTSTNVVFSTSPVLVTPNIGTPSAGVLTSCTGLPIATGVSGLAAGVATFLATPSSANLITAVTDETGTGALVFATSPTLVTPLLGTPTSGVLTNCTGLPVGSITGMAAGVATFLATPSSANLIAAVTDETGTGALVFATSPTLVTPLLGTPTSGVLTSCTGLPIATGVSGLAAGVATFLATPSSANLRAALTDESGTGVAYFQGGSLGTPSAGVLTSCTGLPISTGVSGLGTGIATFLATPSSANLIAAVTDETGTGALVFGTAPTITSSTLSGTSTVPTTISGTFTVSATPPIPTLIGTAALANTPARSLAVSGNYAYCSSAGTVQAFEIFDVTILTTPVKIGGVDLPGAPFGHVVVAGQYAYVCCNFSTGPVQIIDVSNPKAPAIVGSVATAVTGSAMAVSGKYLYMGQGGAGTTVRIYDISNPAATLTIIGSVVLTGASGIRDIVLQGKYAYITANQAVAGTGGFYIVDVTDPTTPGTPVVFNTVGPGNGLVVDGKYAYLSESPNTNGLEVIDVSDPTTPAHVTTFATTQAGVAAGGSLVKAGSYLYFPGSTSVAQIIDITNPAVPVTGPSITTTTNAQGMVVDGRYLYATANQQLRIYDLLTLQTSSLSAGSIDVGHLWVDRKSYFNDDIQAQRGLIVGQAGILSRGPITSTVGIIANTDVYAGATGVVGWTGRSHMTSPADSQILVTNAAATDFARMMFGGTTASFPALKRSTTILQTRLADDSAYGAFESGALRSMSNAGATEGAPLNVDAITGFTSAKLGSSLPVYAMCSSAAPCVGFNMYHTGAIWAFGKGSAAGTDYGGLYQFTTTTGNHWWYTSTATGAANASASPQSVFAVSRNGLVLVGLGNIGGAANTALKSSGTSLQLRLADDSAFASLTASFLGLNGTTPTRPIEMTGTFTTALYSAWDVPATLASSLLGSQVFFSLYPKFAPTGASAAFVTGLGLSNILSGSVAISDSASLYIEPVNLTAYSGTNPASIEGVWVSSIMTGGSATKYATLYTGVSVSGVANGNGLTSGSVGNSGVAISAHTAAAAAGGTIFNRSILAYVPTGSGAGTTSNIGVVITGNGGTGGAGATTNYALFSDSSALSVLSGPLQFVGANSQYTNNALLTELTTIAAAATTNTTMQIPAKSFVIGVTVRVVTVIPTAATFGVGVSGAATRYGTGISTAAGTTAVNGAVVSGFYDTATVLVITPNLTPATATGQIRVTIHYLQLVAPLS